LHARVGTWDLEIHKGSASEDTANRAVDMLDMDGK